MAKRKTLTPIQKAYQQQVKRISRELTELRKQGRPVNQLEKELKQLASKRPTAKGVHKLKEEYSKRKLEHKAGIIRVGKKIITKEEYEAKREQRWERQRSEYRTKREAKQQRKIQKTKDYWEQHLPDIITTKSQPQAQGTPPRLQDLVIDRVQKMITDATTNKGASMLSKELNRQIEKYGRTAVAGAMEQLPASYVEEMETLIKYSSDKEQNSQTIAKIAEAIKSEILNPTERKQIATIADEEEEYG